MKWQTAWLLIKDVLATVTGLALVISQIRAHAPSDVLIVAGLALITPSLATHTYSVLSGPSSAHGHGESGSSPPAPPPGLPPPGSSPDGHGESGG